jgi:hypothetical protein
MNHYRSIKGLNICPAHGVFNTRSKVCPVCKDQHGIDLFSFELIANLRKRKDKGEHYNYKHTVFEHWRKPIRVHCPIHGFFRVHYLKHIFLNHDCPKCKSNNHSSGERTIADYLTQYNYSFIEQHRFPECKDQFPLPFDFYLPHHNACIEFDGIQHHQIVEFFGGTEGFKKRQLHDQIKTDYCKNNGLHLIRIVKEQLKDLPTALFKLTT